MCLVRRKYTSMKAFIGGASVCCLKDDNIAVDDCNMSLSILAYCHVDANMYNIEQAVIE